MFHSFRLGSFAKSYLPPAFALLLVLAFLLYTKLPEYLADQDLLGQPFAFAALESVEDIASGMPLDAEALRGKKVLLHFFATWCLSCKLQIASLKKIYEEHRDNKAFLLIAISAEEAQVLKGLQKEKQLPYTIASDLHRELHDTLQVQVYPTNVWLDEEGRIDDIGHRLNYLLPYTIRYWLKGTLF